MKNIISVIITLSLILSISIPVFSQSGISDQQLKSNLRQHILTLASDKFEGRETGKKGEQLAADYIISQFREIGLEEKGSLNYLQPFPFDAGRKMGKNNSLIINGNSFSAGEDFQTLPFSFSGKVSGEAVKVGYGISAPGLGYDDYKNTNDLTGKIFIIETSNPDGNNPHGKYSDYGDLQPRADSAVARGAAAVIFVNTKKEIEDPVLDYAVKNNKAGSVPVVFAKKAVHQTLLQDGILKAVLQTDVEKIELTANNVIGFLDNKALQTVVIGAHYDHLGYGDHGSLFRGKPAIHNGADDNASGNAALIELARYLKTSGSKSNNYLFIAFSGEEKGLLGSNFFVKNPTIDMKTINYMLNMDMVGRLKKDEKTLIISGVGTSPVWKDIINSIHVDSVKYKLSESGVGPSDHTSFYLRNIPALHFFTGSHEDYHKPTDDEEKINYEGTTSIIRIMIALIEQADKKGKLAFTKTNDSNNEETPRFKVTLGVVPDYAYDGEGMRIDGISDGKPASKAGMLSGDVVLQLGEHKVTDMTSYMKALGKFSKGDTTEVKFKRANEMKEVKITF